MEDDVVRVQRSILTLASVFQWLYLNVWLAPLYAAGSGRVSFKK